MTQPDNPYRHLPEPIPTDNYIETVDVSSLPSRDGETEERERMLRQAGG